MQAEVLPEETDELDKELARRIHRVCQCQFYLELPERLTLCNQKGFQHNATRFDSVLIPRCDECEQWYVCRQCGRGRPRL